MRGTYTGSLVDINEIQNITEIQNTPEIQNTSEILDIPENDIGTTEYKEHQNNGDPVVDLYIKRLIIEKLNKKRIESETKYEFKRSKQNHR